MPQFSKLRLFYHSGSVEEARALDFTLNHLDTDTNAPVSICQEGCSLLRKYLFGGKFPFNMRKILFTTAQAAAELGVTSARVRQMILKGELAAEKFGRDLMISAEAIARAKKRKTTPGPSAAGQNAKTTAPRRKR